MHSRITPAAITLLLATLWMSCTSIKLAVPEQFSSQATAMPVKGLNGIGGRPLSFGSYSTSKIKRGWNIKGPAGNRNSGITTEERIYKIFGVNHQNVVTNQKNKYQYSIRDANQEAEVYCQERMTQEAVEVKTGIGWLGDFSQLKNYQYSFSAVIQPLKTGKEDLWQLVLYNLYDRRNDTARKWYEQPYVEEVGYVSNGTDTMEIRPVRVKNVTSKKGREGKLPFKLLTGYELRLDDGVIAIIDAFGHTIWMYKELDEPTRLIVASVSSALLLRQIQDIKG
jgi:hypothetical protein